MKKCKKFEKIKKIRKSSKKFKKNWKGQKNLKRLKSSKNSNNSKKCKKSSQNSKKFKKLAPRPRPRGYTWPEVSKKLNGFPLNPYPPGTAAHVAAVKKQVESGLQPQILFPPKFYQVQHARMTHSLCGLFDMQSCM